VSTTPAIRIATDSDLRFVRSSWHSNHWKTWACKRIPWESYWPGQDRRIERLLKQSTVLVAYFEDVPDEVLGWACFEGDTLHYVYVKAAYRRAGIAAGLTASLSDKPHHSHPTNEVGRAFMSSIGAQFNPYLVE
jgi:hypothetical protein